MRKDLGEESSIGFKFEHHVAILACRWLLWAQVEETVLSSRQKCILTLDVEDQHFGTPDHQPRFREALEPLLAMMSQRGIRATFFVVGNLARAWAPELRELASAGHEVGLHGYTHRHIAQIGQSAFRDEVGRGVTELGEILGHAPLGFRAPIFSLTRDTPWVPEILANAGFHYSSSVLPAWNPQAGFAGAPKEPFRWAESGLVEFPAPVFGLGRLALPLLGGAYVRLAPSLLVRAAAHSVRSRQGTWTYVHPYDLDVAEPYYRWPHQSALMSRLLFARRRLMLARIDSLCGPSAGRLCDLAADSAFVKSLPEFGAGS